jgi:hypothetical protein
MRSGSISTRTARPGPPTVVTSRVPAMRFSSISAACATCSSSKAPRVSSRVHRVTVTIGTSSMPSGLMMGSPTPSSGDTQSRLAWMVSYSRTSACVRSWPTRYCTVSTAMPGLETE